MHRRSAVVQEQPRRLGLRRVEQLREDVVRGDGSHQHPCADREPGAVRCRVAADEGEGEQVAGQQHVQVHDRRRQGGVQVRPVQQPQPADVDDRGDHRMRQHHHGPGAEQPGQQASPPPGQHPQRERHRCRRDQQQRGDHPDEQVPRDVQRQVGRDREQQRSDDPGHRHHDPRHPPHGAPRGPPGSPFRTSGQHVADGGADQRDDEQLRRDQLDADARAVVGHAGCRAARPVAAISTTPATSSAAAITFQTTS